MKASIQIAPTPMPDFSYEKEPENGFERLSEGFIADRYRGGSQFPFDGEYCTMMMERMDRKDD